MSRIFKKENVILRTDSDSKAKELQVRGFKEIKESELAKNVAARAKKKEDGKKGEKDTDKKEGAK